MVAVTLASCGDDFLEEKMVATITQDYFETETGVEQLIVSTYDALRVTKQYQQGPFAFFTGVDNMMAKSANYAIYSGSVWTSTGNEATYVDGLCGEYTSNQLLGFYPCINNCNRAILSIREGKVDGKFASDQAYAEQRMAEAMFNRSYCIYLMNTLLGDVYVPRGYTTALPENYAYNRETSEMLLKNCRKLPNNQGLITDVLQKEPPLIFWQSFICNVHKGLIMEQQNTDVRRMEVLIILMRSHIWVCYTKEKALLT